MKPCLTFGLCLMLVLGLVTVSLAHFGVIMRQPQPGADPCLLPPL